MTVTAAAQGTATRVGWWLGQVFRAAVGLVLLGGLFGAALGAAAPSDLFVLDADLATGRVAEVVLADRSDFEPPSVRDDGSATVVRWKPVGGGWRVAPLGDGQLAPDPSAGEGSIDQAWNDVRKQAEAAGVPVSLSGPGTPRRLIQVARLAGIVLVLVLIGAPQPRYATKWAWFWILLLPGGLGALAWIAVEAPWSSRANRRPEPLPHNREPDDHRLTGGRSLAITFALGILLSVLAAPLATWLAS